MNTTSCNNNCILLNEFINGQNEAILLLNELFGENAHNLESWNFITIRQWLKQVCANVVTCILKSVLYDTDDDRDDDTVHDYDDRNLK